MSSKLKIVTNFHADAQKWDEKAEELKKSHPLKTLKSLPNIPGIVKETRKNLKLKSLFYLLKHDKNKVFLRYFPKSPFRYAFRLITSFLKEKTYQREGDFFLYGIKNEQEFADMLQNPKILFVLGFSYCHKPFECPSGRFTDACQNDPQNPVCGQCFIGKCASLFPKTSGTILFIPTIHYIGEKLFEIRAKNPKSPILFLITACELTLEMFGDYGKMIQAKGIGVRLDGRICNTMEAFALSEVGIKPGLTVVLSHTQEKMLNLLSVRAAAAFHP